MIKIERIVVAADFSEPSETAFTYGRALARNFDASLHLIHVVENALLYAGLDGVAVDISAIQAEAVASARFKLNALLTEPERSELHATAVVKVGASPAHEIIDYAKYLRADMIVMGTHGRGLMAHLLMGSVAEAVVRRAPCPVLTVRHPEREFVLPDALQLATPTE